MTRKEKRNKKYSMINLIIFFTYLFDSYPSCINNDLSSEDSDFVLRLENNLYISSFILKNTYADKYTEYSTREKFKIKNQAFFEVFITTDFKVFYFEK